MKTKWIRSGAVCVAMLGLSACGDDHSASSMKSIYVETPFSIAKAGSRATLDFQATAQEATPGKVYMVSLTFDRNDGADPLDAVSSRPPRTLLPFKVRVIRLDDDGREDPIELMDGAEFIGSPDPVKHTPYIAQDPVAGIYYAFTYANSGQQGFLCLIRFKLNKPGRYRAEVETVQNQPIFSDVPSVLIVQKRFNLGE